VTGLDKTKFNPTVLFYKRPAPEIRSRFEEAGAAVEVLFPDARSEDVGGTSGGLNLQAKIRRAFGRNVEGLYASAKYIYAFSRYKSPAYRALRQVFESQPIDIVHLNNGLASDMPGILAAARSRLPIVCHVRAFSQHTPVHIWASRFVSRFLCVSSAIRDYVVESGVDPTRCVICHDSVNQQRFRKMQVDRAGFLEQFGWSESDRVFGIIGRLDSWKGHEYFIEAIEIARRSNPAVRGLIVGDITPSSTNRAYVDGLKRHIEAAKLESHIAFAGHRSNIPEIMQCIDGVVCASSSPEPFGLMVVEAMAVGTAVIATNAGGPADMITDGEDGLLVPLKDSVAIAAAMLRLASERTLVEHIVATGERTVNARFTMAHHVDKVCNEYNAILDIEL
jgi:glycosyltransferase involved in cell wall biosynthesis